MPPKPKYTKTEIIEKAYLIVKRDGVDALVARSLASELESTTAPIFTYFESMDELRHEVFKLALEEFEKYQKDCFDYFPAFKKFGMNWVQFAKDRPNVYKFLFLKELDYDNLLKNFRTRYQDFSEKMIIHISDMFKISKEESEYLFDSMRIYVNGVALSIISDPDSFSEAWVCASISETCIGIVNNIRIRNNTFVMPMAEAFVNAYDDPPKRI